MLTAVPFLLLVDYNGGLVTFGFTRAQLQQEFKVKPDYLTGQLLATERKELPTFRYF